MSANWGDFNGDGRTDYVDYKIYTTQVDPYSGEYQRDAFKVMQEFERQNYQPLKSNLSFGEWVIIFIGVAVFMLIAFGNGSDTDTSLPIGVAFLVVYIIIFGIVKSKRNKDK